MPTLVPGRAGSAGVGAGPQRAGGRSGQSPGLRALLSCAPPSTRGRVLLVGASVSQCGTVRQRVQAGLQAQASRSSAALGGLWGAAVWERKRQVSPRPGVAPGGGREALNAWTVHFRAFIDPVVGGLGACGLGAVAGWPAVGSCFGRLGGCVAVLADPTLLALSPVECRDAGRSQSHTEAQTAGPAVPQLQASRSAGTGRSQEDGSPRAERPALARAPELPREGCWAERGWGLTCREGRWGLAGVSGARCAGVLTPGDRDFENL